MAIPLENQAFPPSGIVGDDPWATPDDIGAVDPVKA